MTSGRQQSMEPQEHAPPLRAERDSANNLSNNSNVKGGGQPSASTEGVDGASGRSGVGTSNGTHDASVGDAKIGGQLPSAASAGIGGGPAKSDATLRWART